MSLLYAVDPGTQDAGLAVFRDKRLVAAWHIRAVGATLEARVRSAVSQMLVLVDSGVPREVGEPLGAVCEMPQVYKHGPGAQVDPDSILSLTLVVGGLLCGSAPLEWRLVKPAGWKGQVPKRVMNSRVLGKLENDERELVRRQANDNHNTLDAVGIGLWALSRLG